jgi:hypothetical protein
VPRFDDGRYVTAQVAYLLGWGGACVMWPPLSATRDRAHDDPGPESTDDEIGDHLPGDH